MIFFLHEYRVNYKVANFAILIALISGVIVLIFNMMNGMPWFIALKYLTLKEFKGVNTTSKFKLLRNYFDFPLLGEFKIISKLILLIYYFRRG